MIQKNLDFTPKSDIINIEIWYHTKYTYHRPTVQQELVLLTTAVQKHSTFKNHYIMLDCCSTCRQICRHTYPNQHLNRIHQRLQLMNSKYILCKNIIPMHTSINKVLWILIQTFQSFVTKCIKCCLGCTFFCFKCIENYMYDYDNVNQNLTCRDCISRRAISSSSCWCPLSYFPLVIHSNSSHL